jgi:lysosomal acid lipase/cholesteryl ester hydrolase
MANTLTSIILVILFFGLAVGSRTKLISVKSQDGMSALAPVPNDGICTSMVETQGYVCEEHKVICLHIVLKFIAKIH